VKRVLLVLLAGITASAQGQSASERFYQAVRNDDLTALRALLKTSGPDTKDSLGHTPLMIAAAFGSVDSVQLLIAAGADVKAVSNSGVTALHWATGDARKVHLLLERGVDVNARSSLGRTPLIVAASSSGTAEVVALLLGKGADVNTADVIGVTPLIAASSVDDVAVAKLLLGKGASVNAKANIGQAATPLMGAAYNGNVELTRLLLDQNADVEATSADRAGTVKNGPVQFGHVTALHMGTASGNVDVVKLLLDAGARVDPLDVRGMTPLMWSVSTDRPQPRVVRMLLDKGADVSLRSKLGENVLDWARKFNNPLVLAELKLEAADSASVPTATRVGERLLTTREAVDRSIPLLRGASARMMTAGGCVACHAQPVAVMAAELASTRGWGIEQDAADASLISASLSAASQILMQAREGGGVPDTHLYNAMAMATQHAAPSFATDALVRYLSAKQRPEGNWHGIGATRAPMQDGDFSRTAMSIRALSVYGTPALKTQNSERIERAAAWLGKQTPLSTEDRVMQLLGLKWANANSKLGDTRTRELAALQRADGGWSQTPFLASDAYATGQVLFTLRELGAAASDPALQRGAAFLLRTQREDGSWHVKSRAMKIQPYFESGFPYSHDQWISQTGTAWAVMALSQTPEQPVLRARSSER
jgi:ankyrin repeat protein